MVNTPLPSGLDELFQPESRAEVQHRLNRPHHRGERELALLPKTQTRCGFGTFRSPARSSLITREEVQALIKNPRAGESFSPSANHSEPSWNKAGGWFARCRDPHSVRELLRSSRFRRAFWITPAFGIVVLVGLLLASAGESPMLDDSETPAAAPTADAPRNLALRNPEPRITKTQEAARPAQSQVTICVESPAGVRIEVDDSVHHNTNQVSLPLAPGRHRLKISKAGYETIERTFHVLGLDRQELPGVVLGPLPATSESVPPMAPVQVLSAPEGAAILLDGEPTGYKTPAVLDPHFASGSLSVRLEGYRIRRADSERFDGVLVRKFSLEQIPPPPPEPDLTDLYGFRLNDSERRSLASAVEKLLISDWKASPKIGARDAHHHFATWAPFSKGDPRLHHAYGLTLWHHGEMTKAKKALIAAVEREEVRPGRKVPYYPLYRDKIRLRSVTGEEVGAAEDLLDLIRDTAKMLDNHPGEGWDEARKNADFAGRLVGFLEGPARAAVAHDVNLRMLSSHIETSLSQSELQETYQSARSAVLAQYEKERAAAEALRQAREQKERDLQASGELGRTNIRSRDNRFTGKRERSDYNSQIVTPFSVPFVTRFVTDGGLVRLSTGPAFYFPNVLFSRGPAIGRSYFNNRTVETTRDLRKVVLEELPAISRRRPKALSTYVPEELERKRREILEAVCLNDKGA